MASLSEFADILKEVFFHRRDCYGLQTMQGGEWRWVCVKHPVSRRIITSHIKGEKTIGAYLLNTDNTIRYIVFDFDDQDEYECLTTAKGFCLWLARQWEVTPLLEHTGNRYHVWLFFREAVSGERGYALGRALARLARLNVEVFPKQRQLTPDMPYGNLIRLPCGVHPATGQRGTFIDVATANRLDSEGVLGLLLSLPEVGPDDRVWEAINQAPPERPKYAPPARVDDGFRLSARRIKYVRALLEGVEQSAPHPDNNRAGRNEACFHLALVMARMGFHIEDAIAALEVWNQRNRPPLDARELEGTIKNAYRAARDIAI